MRFKSTDYSQNLQQNAIAIFVHIFSSLIVSSRHHRLQMANKADEVLLGKRPRQQATAIKNPRKMYGKNCNLWTLSGEYDCLAIIGTKKAFRLLLEN